MSNRNKPKHFLVFKIVGFVGILLLIFGIILTIKGFGDFESNNFMIGAFVSPLGLFISAIGLSIGFKPEIRKKSIQSYKYIQEQNKEDLKEIISSTAKITEDAITTTAKAVKNGVDNVIYCKYCGAQIDTDSVFCKKCGKAQ